jgi:hypothetical protein
MAKRQAAIKKDTRRAQTKPKETDAINLQPTLQLVRVWRPKNIVTTVNDVDDIDVRDGSLLLLRREPNRSETCMAVFSPGQWITVNVEPA